MKKQSPVITIHISDNNKKVLKDYALKHGMQLATYCRMILLKSIEEK
jgi:predicted DNA binding CopG/RHH family protein